MTPGHPCGSIGVLAAVRHPKRHTAFEAWATAHLAGGDVTVHLRRAGKSFVAVGRIPVPAKQPAGVVTVDVTIHYGADVVVKTLTTHIVATGP